MPIAFHENCTHRMNLRCPKHPRESSWQNFDDPNATAVASSIAPQKGIESIDIYI